MNLAENVLGRRVEQEILVAVCYVQAQNNGRFDQSGTS